MNGFEQTDTQSWNSAVSRPRRLLPTSQNYASGGLPPYLKQQWQIQPPEMFWLMLLSMPVVAFDAMNYEAKTQTPPNKSGRKNIDNAERARATQRT